MSAIIIAAREKFLRRQIERAWELAEHYRTLNDPTSAAWFEDWAWRIEFELEQLAERIILILTKDWVGAWPELNDAVPD